jgi:hypothetical protein
MHKPLFIAGNAQQDAKAKQRPAHRHKFAPLMLRTEREGELAVGERWFAGEFQQPLTENAKSDLRLGAIEHGACQAQQHVAAAVVVRQTARGIGQVRRTFVKTRAFALDVQRPAGLTREPLAQGVGVAAHRREVVMHWVHQRRHQ